MGKQNGMGHTTWRYQVVYGKCQNVLGGTYDAFTLCEVYLDENQKLTMWTKNQSIPPSGGTCDELIEDIPDMLIYAKRWKPVAFHELRVGMEFEEVG